nr:hypothetical transcript [Hymenolepis microstoma]
MLLQSALRAARYLINSLSLLLSQTLTACQHKSGISKQSGEGERRMRRQNRPLSNHRRQPHWRRGRKMHARLD